MHGSGTPEEEEGEAAAPSGLSFGDWLQRAREQAGLSRQQLSELAGVSSMQIWNIETGTTANPRPLTREKLAHSVGAEPSARIIEETESAARVVGVGILTDFDPHRDSDLPTEPGIYIFYDRSQRPVYIGQGQDIRTRALYDHKEKFWYRRPIVETGAYIRVDDEQLRIQIERILIKCLKTNAILNKQHAG